MTSQKPTRHLGLYREYVRGAGNRIELFRVVQARFGIERGIYPGSYVHVTPSLVIPEMAYNDSDRRTRHFFTDAAVLGWLDRHKEHARKPVISFHFGDYREPLAFPDDHYELLISQWAGFVSQHCKRYLKSGGILLANNSHGDASMANLDPDFEFIGAISRSNKIIEEGLDRFFVPKKPQAMTRDQLVKLGRGIGYTNPAPYYLFRCNRTESKR